MALTADFLRATANPAASHSATSFPTPLPFLAFPNYKPIFKRLACRNDSKLKCSFGYAPTVAYPRPSEIQWKKELCNSVQLIGIVATPVQINQLSSGKVVAWSRIAVRKSASDTSWINLTFWDELAHIAYQHVEKGQQIYISGRLISDSVENDDGKQQTFYKVVVQQLNFIGKNFSSPVALYDGSSNSVASGRKFDNSAANNKGSIEELWQAFFANPVDWWDNRKNKKNPKYPDFKHKDTGEALWVEGRNNPPWVKSQLEILDSRMETFYNHSDSRPFDFLNGGGDGHSTF
ncbi:hypothetical protein Nepgr_022707 [Nepenthes gracilis]|uniref:Uncharacterized protein n=1 Tax=Nepenthes gracilis TaxID=150966 RepID=A0AAD3XYE9_NEPGR|nr:hypothetical protein Nepgr_022707 [Nepenthes gracilis]